jgi:hypothetical protein
MPDCNDFEGVAEEAHKVMILVEEDVSQPRPCDKTYEDVEHEGIHPGPFEADGLGALLSWDQKIGGEKSQHIHEAVPSHLKRADSKNIRMDIRVRNHKDDPPLRFSSIFIVTILPT